jgi:peptide/nickel transport system permease protein
MPGLAIFIVSLGFNLLGDGLRDVLDPKRSAGPK